MTKKFYVLDTSVYLTDPRVIYSYGTNDIIVPLIVLEELDNCKKRPNGAGINARSIIRILDGLREKGNFQKGIRIRKGAGLVFTKAPDLNELPVGYSPSIADHQIIATALTLKKESPVSEKSHLPSGTAGKKEAPSLATPLANHRPGGAFQRPPGEGTHYTDLRRYRLVRAPVFDRRVSRFRFPEPCRGGIE